MEKQKLLYEQNRLANRGAAETVLLYISASKGILTIRWFFLLFHINRENLGEYNEMLQRTLQLGISLLHGGNREVQKVNSNLYFYLFIIYFILANVELFKRNKRCWMFYFISNIND
jgi:hypothetical protein